MSLRARPVNPTEPVARLSHVLSVGQRNQAQMVNGTANIATPTPEYPDWTKDMNLIGERDVFLVDTFLGPQSGILFRSVVDDGRGEYVVAENFKNAINPITIQKVNSKDMRGKRQVYMDESPQLLDTINVKTKDTAKALLKELTITGIQQAMEDKNMLLDYTNIFMTVNM